MNSNDIPSESMAKEMQVVDISKSPFEADHQIATKYISPEKNRCESNRHPG